MFKRWRPKQAPHENRAHSTVPQAQVATTTIATTGQSKTHLRQRYKTHNTTRLDVDGMKALLLKLDFMQRIARGERVEVAE